MSTDNAQSSQLQQFPFEEFLGFEAPKTTPVPDILFDLLAPHLSDAELRVLLYIIRRIFGFKKDSDNISLSQMVNGITTRDGRVLDYGTGLKKAGVAKALVGLINKGLITKKLNRSTERGNEPTTYTLRFRQVPLSTVVDKGVSTPVDKPLSTVVDTQETVLQETGGQETVRDSTKNKNQVSITSNLKGVLGGERSTAQAPLPEPQNKVRGQAHQSSISRLPASGPIANILLGSSGRPSSPTDLGSANQARVEGGNPPPNPDQNSESGATVADTGSTHGLTSISELISRHSSATPRNAPQSLPEARRTASKSTAVLEDLQAHASRKKAQGQPKKPKGKFLSTPYLDRVIEEFSQLDLRDPEHVPSNQHQARNLMVQSGMEETRFVQNFVYPARSQTKAAASVSNRGAYFFTCLRDLLGLREDEAGPIPPPQSRARGNGIANHNGPNLTT